MEHALTSMVPVANKPCTAFMSQTLFSLNSNTSTGKVLGVFSSRQEALSEHTKSIAHPNPVDRNRQALIHKWNTWRHGWAKDTAQSPDPHTWNTIPPWEERPFCVLPRQGSILKNTGYHYSNLKTCMCKQSLIFFLSGVNFDLPQCTVKIKPKNKMLQSRV